MSQENFNVVFILEGLGSVRMHVPAKGTTPAETKTFQAARKQLGATDNIVKFTPIYGEVRKSQAVVTHPDVAKAVRILAGRSIHYSVHQDVQLLKIRCPYCDFTTSSNTQADQIALAEHVADKHQDADAVEEDENK